MKTKPSDSGVSLQAQLQAFMSRHGYNQKQIALRLGISGSHVCEWINGVRGSAKVDARVSELLSDETAGQPLATRPVADDAEPSRQAQVALAFTSALEAAAEADKAAWTAVDTAAKAEKAATQRSLTREQTLTDEEALREADAMGVQLLQGSGRGYRYVAKTCGSENATFRVVVHRTNRTPEGTVKKTMATLLGGFRSEAGAALWVARHLSEVQPLEKAVAEPAQAHARDWLQQLLAQG